MLIIWKISGAAQITFANRMFEALP